MSDSRLAVRVRRLFAAGAAVIPLTGCNASRITGIDTNFARDWPYNTPVATRTAHASPTPTTPPATPPSTNPTPAPVLTSTPTLAEYVQNPADANTLGGIVLQDLFNCGESISQWNPKTPISPEYYPEQFQFLPPLLAALRDFRQGNDNSISTLLTFVQEQSNLRKAHRSFDETQTLINSLQKPAWSQRGYLADQIYALIDRTGIALPAPGKVQAHTHLVMSPGALGMSEQDRTTQDFVIGYNHGTILLADRAGNIVKQKLPNLELQFWLDLKTAEALAIQSTLSESASEAIKYLQNAAKSSFASGNKEALAESVQFMYHRYLNRIAASDNENGAQSRNIFNNFINDLQAISTRNQLGLDLSERSNARIPNFDASTAAERDPGVFYTVPSISPVKVERHIVSECKYDDGSFVHQAFPEGTCIPPGLPVPMQKQRTEELVYQLASARSPHQRQYGAGPMNDFFDILGWTFPIGIVAAGAAAIWSKYGQKSLEKNAPATSANTTNGATKV